MNISRIEDSYNAFKTRSTILCKSVQILGAIACLIRHGLDKGEPDRFLYNLVSGVFGATAIVQSFYLLCFLRSDQVSGKTMLIRNAVLIGAYYWISGVLFDAICQSSYNVNTWAALMNPLMSVVIILVLLFEVAVNLIILQS
ncbi:hypothetical protein M8J76_009367 [Diaphorina citri]|nr:hypothetical protein M8J76_009367 [Diaphorina citri]